ncbi:hypothetical protein AMECASPLE_037889 [Ameca splendens]|uniref:Transposase IS30-like HTH domain-containing protein n=1 Tax=Ameca splendens TaxID=208324 RepID=A0ABV1A3T9_9TELE
MTTNEHSRQVRENDVEKFKAGLGSKTISQALNISHSSVQSIDGNSGGAAEIHSLHYRRVARRKPLLKITGKLVCSLPQGMQGTQQTCGERCSMRKKPSIAQPPKSTVSKSSP